MQRPLIALAIVLGSFSPGNVFSQSAAASRYSSYAKIIPPSPNVAAMEKFGNTSVSHYTGVPDISIPLYQIVSRDITVPISLSYHAGGVRISEEASRVGLGWSLQAGGVISRSIINIDDFQVSSSAFLSSLNDSPELKQNPEYVATQEVFYGTQFKLMRTSDHELESFELGDYAKIADFDFEPDNFNYSFSGHSGKFILTREREAMILKKEKIDIRVIGDYADRWEIRTADGYKYEFSEYETVKGDDQIAHRSAWHLTKIVSPKGAEVIFNYTNQSQQYIQPQGEYFEMISPYKQTPCSDIECQTIPPIKESIQGKYYSNVYLESIEWPLGKVKFNYSDDRIDLKGDVKLSSIQVFEKPDKLFQTIELKYDYFTSASMIGFNYNNGAEVDRNTKRLKLTRINKKGIAPGEPVITHTFSYYEGGDLSLPVKNSFARDHWGFYNGRNANNSLLPSYTAAQNSIGNYQNYIGVLGPERNASERHAGAFTLKEIKYPTGGRTTFQYESNDFSALNPSIADDVVQSTQILTKGFYNGANKGTVYEQELDFSDPYIEAAGKIIPVELTAAFRATGPCKNVLANPSLYFELYEINPDQTQTRISRVDFGLDICANDQGTICIYCDKSQNSQSPIFSYKNSYQLKPQKYIWKAFMGANESNFNDITATYRWLASTPPAVNGVVHNYGYGGGQRIKIIQDFDPYSNSPSNVRRFEYRHQEFVNDRQELKSYGKRMGEPRYSYFEFSAETAVIQNNSGIEGTPQQGSVVCMDCRHQIRTSESGVSLSNLQGVAVGYSKVTEYLGMNGEFGKIEYVFENEADLIKPFFQPGNELIPIKPSRVPTYSNPKNGMLISKTEYNAAGTKVHQISNTNVVKFSAGYFGLEKRPLRIIGDAVDEPTLVLYTALPSYFAVVADSRETFFSPVEQPEKVTETIFEYNNPEHLQLTSSAQRKSNGNLVTSFYKYPADYPNEQCPQVVLQMKGAAFLHANQIENLVVEAINGENLLTDQTIINYDIFGGRILPKTIAVRELDRPLLLSNFSPYVPANNFTENDFTTLTLNYYTSGNVKEITKEDDYTISYLWGYQNHFPIGEFKNASHAQVSSVFGDATINQLSLSTDQQYIRSAFASRISNVAFNQSEIKYFTYNPITGVNTSGDQNGITQFYEYDSAGRLVLIKDNNANIQKHFSYGYKK